MRGTLRRGEGRRLYVQLDEIKRVAGQRFSRRSDDRAHRSDIALDQLRNILARLVHLAEDGADEALSFGVGRSPPFRWMLPAEPVARAVRVVGVDAARW